MNTPHSIGDRVRVNRPGSELHGTECTVMTEAAYESTLGPNGVEIKLVHTVDIPAPPDDELGDYGFSPHELIPLYDGNEKTTWEVLEDIWQPVGVGV